MEASKLRNKMAKQKSGKNWILDHEFEDFFAGVKQAIMEASTQLQGPFQQLLKYDPSRGGMFPPAKYWEKDFARVLFGLEGEAG